MGRQPGERFFVEFTDPLFSDIWATGKRKRVAKDQKFLEKVDTMRQADLDALGPAYLCHRCGRLEDGTHRSWARKLNGHKGMDVLVGRMCWKTIELLPSLLQWLIEIRRLKTKDIPWMTGCGVKWSHLDGVNFSGKTYLDVGAQSGYSAIMGWNRGARVDAVELRPEIYAVAQQAAIMFNANEITMHNGDWAKIYNAFDRHDVVSCMGLMHYFPIDSYSAILGDLCCKAKEVLILELRIIDNASGEFRQVGSQTLISREYLERVVAHNGFAVVKRANMKEPGSRIFGGRELWIMERK